ncbi:MAG: ferrous iron transport protein B [Paludibacteraceae bacterium]|nr:ferrous iron transport protein B [Paludibacteraceae bacterium]MBQ6984455.1 ferrous iron transport protein B [Paludibacteraceae bacterium]
MIKIAVIGLPQSGKSSLTKALQTLADQGQQDMHFVEVYHPDELHGHAFDVVLQVVDSTRLEESLMLTPHIIDEQEKIVLAIGRYDLLLKTDHSLNIPKLEQLIGVPTCRVSVRLNYGLPNCLSILQQVAEQPTSKAHPIHHLRDQADEDTYRAYVHGILTETLTHAKDDQQQTRLEKIDKVLTNPWLGFPIMMAVLYFVFWCTFTLGAYPQEWIASGIELTAQWLNGLVTPSWWSSMLIDGVLQGVGAVLAFLPNIIILFFFISLMEDSGYMAREAFIMDTIMHKIGLHGRSFIPMLMGFGCNVPAIMAAKDIQNPKDRLLTMLMVPFMSCSARLPVYMLFVDTFFERHKALVMISLYAIGICLSVVFALVMKRTKWFRQEEDDTVNELPTFKLPKLRIAVAHIWEKVADYLQKICTVIIWASVIIWALEYFPNQDLNDLENSYLAAIGQFISPLLEPLGFDWKMSVCLLTGLPAKEAIVSTLAILYGGDLSAAGFTPLTAFTFMLFVLLYFPCVATTVTLRREAGRGWAWFMVFHSLLLAWVISFIVYQIGMLL